MIEITNKKLERDFKNTVAFQMCFRLGHVVFQADFETFRGVFDEMLGHRRVYVSVLVVDKALDSLHLINYWRYTIINSEVF